MARHDLLEFIRDQESATSGDVSEAFGTELAWSASGLRHAWHAGQLHRMTMNPETTENPKPGPPKYEYKLSQSGMQRLKYYDKMKCRTTYCKRCANGS